MADLHQHLKHSQTNHSHTNRVDLGLDDGTIPKDQQKSRTDDGDLTFSVMGYDDL